MAEHSPWAPEKILAASVAASVVGVGLFFGIRRLTQQPPPSPPNAVAAATSPTPSTPPEVSELERRLRNLEARLAHTESVSRRVFTLTHYNILASQYGSNMEPWFCYLGSGKAISAEKRAMLKTNHVAKGPDGRYLNVGWPTWAKAGGALTEEEIAAVERVDERHFSWETRKHRLVDEMLSGSVLNENKV